MTDEARKKFIEAEGATVKKTLRRVADILTSDHSFADLLDQFSAEDGENYAPGLREELRRQETIPAREIAQGVTLEVPPPASTTSSSSSSCARCHGRRYVIDAVTHARRACFECGPKACDVCEGDRVLYDDANEPVVCSACKGKGSQ